METDFSNPCESYQVGGLWAGLHRHWANVEGSRVCGFQSASDTEA